MTRQLLHRGNASIAYTLLLLVVVALVVTITGTRPACAQYVYGTLSTQNGTWIGNDRWLIDGSPVGTDYPDAIDATATFNAPVSTVANNSTIGMVDSGNPITVTVGGITVVNGDGNNTFNLAISGVGTGGASRGTIVFQTSSAETPAFYTESGPDSQGSTTVNAHMNLLSNLVVTQDHIDSNGTLASTTFSGLINAEEDIKFTKLGSASLNLSYADAVGTGEGFFGRYEVNQGALRFSSNALLQNAAGVTVTSGGQMLLTAGGPSATPAVHSLANGASLSLQGAGVASGSANEGALRFQMNRDLVSEFSSPIILSTVGFSTSIIVQTNASSTGTNQAVARLSGIISGVNNDDGIDGGFVKEGTGDLYLVGTEANTYQGATVIGEGYLYLAKPSGTVSVPGNLNVGGSATVVVQNNQQIADTSLVRFTSTTANGGILRIGGQNRQETVGGILSTNGPSGTIESNYKNVNNSSTATFTIAGAYASEFHGLIRDTGYNPQEFNGKLAIAKTGAEPLTLTGNNTYSGGTTVSGGTLFANNSTGSATGGGVVTVNSGGTLGGTGIVSGAVTLNTGGHLAPGAGVESLDVGALTLNAGSVLDFELGAPGSPGISSDLLNVLDLDGLSINGGSVAITDAGGLVAGTYRLIDYNNSFVGSIASLGTPTGPSGFTFSLQDNAIDTSIDLVVEVSAGVPGDYNTDGKVDILDYVVWRMDPDSHGGTPDGFEDWAENYGNPPEGSGGVSSAVPEPGTILLMALIAPFVITRRFARS